MKNIYRVVLVLFPIVFLLTNCSDKGTNAESKKMRIYAQLANRYGSSNLQSLGSIDVYYYPAVREVSINLDSKDVYEYNDSYGITRSSWRYEEYYGDTTFHWTCDKSYELEITANNGEYVSTGSCELPGEFVIYFDSLPNKINPLVDFDLKWSDCENETNFILNYSIYINDSSSVPSSNIIDPNTNAFTFTTEKLNIEGAKYLYFNLTAINGPPMVPNSDGNFSGDGVGYFYGKYYPCYQFVISYSNSENVIFDQTKKNNELKEKEEELFKKYLGF